MKFSWNYALVVAVIAIVLIVAFRAAHPAGAYPPISTIAAELNLSIGQQLPKGVIWQGRPFFFYIIGARESGNGEYDVRLKAR